MRDLEDVKDRFEEMGGENEEFLEHLEQNGDTLYQEHTNLLRAEIPKMLNDPIYQPYMAKLIDAFKKNGLVTDAELKYFKGTLDLQNLDKNMMENRKRKRGRNLGKAINIHAEGLNKQQLLSEFDQLNNYYNPVDTLLTLKYDPNTAEVRGENGEELDSLTLLQKREELKTALLRLKKDKKLDEEQKFYAEELEDLLTREKIKGMEPVSSRSVKFDLREELDPKEKKKLKERPKEKKRNLKKKPLLKKEEEKNLLTEKKAKVKAKIK